MTGVLCSSNTNIFYALCFPVKLANTKLHKACVLQRYTVQHNFYAQLLDLTLATTQITSKENHNLKYFEIQLAFLFISTEKCKNG